jgi:HSP20 family protein
MANINKPFSFSLVPFNDWDRDFFGNIGNIFSEGKSNLPVEASEWSPRIDIKEEDKRFIITADIPGVDPKSINITVDKNTIQMRGDKESEYKKEGKNYVHTERFKGSFSRSISLPGSADMEHISAKGRHGVLEIVIPKTQKGGSRKIEVKDEN